MEKKKLLILIISILLAALVIAGGTFAYFQWSSGVDDRTGVNVTIEAGQITMHIEPETTVMSTVRPTKNCANSVSYGDALMKIENKTGAMAIPSFKLSVRVIQNGNEKLDSDDLSHIHYAVVPVETTSNGGKGNEAADCANPVSFDLDSNDLYFTGTSGTATGTFATVSTLGEWSDLPSTSGEYLPRQFNTQIVTPYGVTFLGKPHTTSYQWFRVYVWIDEGYTFTNTGSNITDPLQHAKIEVTWSTNSMLEQVSSIISGGDAVVAKEAGYYENGTRIYTWDELIENNKVIFYGDTNDMEIVESDYDMTGELVIQEGVKVIGQDAFGSSFLTNIYIPNSLVTIENRSFSASLLEEITFGKNSQLTSIGEYAFDNTAITNITIPDSVQTIGDYAFTESLLEEITFGTNSQLTTIGDGAFEFTNLRVLELPSSLTSIGSYAFDGTQLTEITYMGTMAQWSLITFGEDWNGVEGIEPRIIKVICSDGTIEL